MPQSIEHVGDSIFMTLQKMLGNLVTPGCWKNCQNQTSSPCFSQTAQFGTNLQILQTELSTWTQTLDNPNICMNRLRQEKMFRFLCSKLGVTTLKSISCFNIFVLWQIFSNCDEQSLFNKPKCLQFSLLKEKIKPNCKHCRKSEILMKVLQNTQS